MLSSHFFHNANAIANAQCERNLGPIHTKLLAIAMQKWAEIFAKEC